MVDKRQRAQVVRGPRTRRAGKLRAQSRKRRQAVRQAGRRRGGY